MVGPRGQRVETPGQHERVEARPGALHGGRRRRPRPLRAGPGPPVPPPGPRRPRPPGSPGPRPLAPAPRTPAPRRARTGSPPWAPSARAPWRRPRPVRRWTRVFRSVIAVDGQIGRERAAVAARHLPDVVPRVHARGSASAHRPLHTGHGGGTAGEAGRHAAMPRAASPCPSTAPGPGRRTRRMPASPARGTGGERPGRTGHRGRRRPLPRPSRARGRRPDTLRRKPPSAAAGRGGASRPGPRGGAETVRGGAARADGRRGGLPSGGHGTRTRAAGGRPRRGRVTTARLTDST